MSLDSETPTRRFRPLPFTDVQWTGTNHAEIADKFGTDWEESLVGHPLLIGNWLYRLEGGPEVYVMTSRVRDAFTEEVLDAPHSPAEPVSPVSTPTEAHGETGEAQGGSR